MEGKDKKTQPLNRSYGDSGSRHLSDYVYSERIDNRSRAFDWVIPLHLHGDLYQFFFIARGSLVLRTPEGDSALAAPAIVAVPPNTLHGFDWSKDVEGHIVTVSGGYVEKVLAASPAVMERISSVHLITSFSEKYPLSDFLCCIARINRDLFGDFAERQQYLCHAFGELLILLYRNLQESEQQAREERNCAVRYYRAFLAEVAETPYNRKSIPEYAQQLGITAAHLNRVCRAVGGESALWVIQQRLVQKAQRQLLHTAYSVAEIGCQLHVEDPAYFSRLFKQHTSVSPKMYRQLGGEIPLKKKRGSSN